MSFTVTSLATELRTDPTGIGYAVHLASGNDSATAALLNVGRTPGLRQGTRATELTILDLLGPQDGETFLQRLELAAVGNPVVARVLRILKQSSGQGGDAGVDVGIANVQAMLQGLASSGAVSQSSVDTLVAAGTRLWSRAEVLWGAGTVISEQQVGQARNGGA